MQKTVNKRIAFVTYNYPLDVSSMLLNSIALLSKSNDVQVIVSPLDGRHSLCPDWVRSLLVYAPFPSRKNFFYRAFRKLCIILSKILPSSLSAFSWRLKNFDILLFTLWFYLYSKIHHFDLIIAVECHALISTIFSANKKCKMLYYDMELLDWSSSSELYADKQILKQMQFAALQKVSYVFITSPLRANIFCDINKFPPERVRVLPVVPRRSSFVTEKSAYFRELFNIPTDKKIVIYSGNFMPWAKCLEIINTVSQWPQNFVLIMHTWNNDSLASEYVNSMKSTAKDLPVYFSSDYIPYDKISYALSSADIGLLFYDEIDVNFSEILFSSNKMGEYMAACLPILCSNFPSLKDFVDEHGIGFAISIDDLPLYLNKIDFSYEKYRNNVLSCRDRFFNFDKWFYTAFFNIS